LVESISHQNIDERYLDLELDLGYDSAKHIHGTYNIPLGRRIDYNQTAKVEYLVL